MVGFGTTRRLLRAAACWLVVLMGVGLVVPPPALCAAEQPPTETDVQDKRQDSGQDQHSAAREAEPPEATPQEYYELYKLLADALDQVDRNYVKEVDRRKLVEAALRGMLGELDPYSAYIDPAELESFRDTIDAEFGGIGAQVAIENGKLKVISPLVGSPAYRAGVLAGDVIVEIDGESTEGLTLEEAVKRLKGPEGTQVNITVIHPGTRGKQTITLTREIIHVETVLGDRRKEDDSWDYMIDHEQRIGYVRLTGFSRGTAAELQRVIEELRLQGMRALILDLRFNPGGLLRSAIEISDMFISEGVIVSTEGRNSPKRVWKAHRPGTYDDFPMVVLVNRYSASASEIVAACLQDHQRAVIMGERTWGKGSVQNLIELENGRSALKLTTAAYQRPSGKKIHRFPEDTEEDTWGVTPDEGFELRLGDSEIVGLLRDRRERDIVRPHPTTEDAGASQVSGPTSPGAEVPMESAPSGAGPSGEAPGDESSFDEKKSSAGKQPKPGGNDASAADVGNVADQADHTPAQSHAPEATSPVETDTPGATGTPDRPQPPDRHTEPEDRPDEPTRSDAGAQQRPKPAEAEPEEPAFVDRQLEMALNYLWTELARAEAAAEGPEE